MSLNPNNRVREILRILDQDRDLPTLSPVVEKVLRLVGDEKVSVRELADVIKNDVSLSFKILKVVNSAFYGFPRKISTLSQAVVILGLSAVKNLALSMSILELFVRETSKNEVRKGFTMFWERSLFSAVTAKQFAKLIHHPNEEEVFIAALLQDIGALVFIKYFPEEYAQLTEKVRHNATELTALEDQQFGINHALIGEFLANKWRLPRSLTIPILHHHDPEVEIQGMEEEEVQAIRQLTYLVHLSNLTSSIFYEEYRSDRVVNLKKNAKRFLNLSPETIDDLLKDLAAEVKEVAEFFGVPLKEAKNYSELLMAVNMELGELNISYEQMNRELVAAKRRAEELATQLAEVNRKLLEMANVDGLTQTFNRRVFQNLITREFYRSQRYGHPLSCIMIDLDHFKAINDTEGHLVGDQVLKGVAGLLQSNLRKTDFLARYGGEEFVVILPEADDGPAKILAEKLRTAVESQSFDIEGRPIKVTISLGIATFSKDSPMNDEEELIRRADQNLYMAKRHGRNQSWSEEESLTMEEIGRG